MSNETAPTPPAATPEYGEPWPSDKVYEERQGELTGRIVLIIDPHAWQRAVACVNPLAGIADPAAELARLQRIERVAREFKDADVDMDRAARGQLPDDEFRAMVRRHEIAYQAFIEVFELGATPEPPTPPVPPPPAG